MKDNYYYLEGEGGWNTVYFTNSEYETEVAFFPSDHNIEYIVELLNKTYRKGLQDGKDVN